MATGQTSGRSSSSRDSICNAGAGAATGIIAATFVCPLDVIKTRLDVHGLPPGHKGSIIVTGLQKIVKEEGWRGLYRGLSPTVLALIPNWAVWFTVYERLKIAAHSNNDGHGQVNTGANIIASAGAGAATNILTNPLWVVKTRLQTQGMRTNVVPYRGVLSALSRIMNEEGFRGLYSGMVPSLVGVSHVVIQLPLYEQIKYYTAKKENTSVEQLSPTSVAISSFLAKVPASVITYPHEVIRSRLQEQGQARNSNVRYAGFIDCIKKVYLREGILGFFHGCPANLLRVTPTAVITFTSYEMIRQFLQRKISSDERYSQS